MKDLQLSIYISFYKSAVRVIMTLKIVRNTEYCRFVYDKNDFGNLEHSEVWG